MQSSVSQLIVPERLRPGDTVALISLSGGRAGDPDLLPRYQEGKRRLEKLFGLRTVETPHALKGSAFLYDHPELRAADLMWALENPEVRGVFCIMGGDDSYRVLPYVDLKVIREHPKVFMGYSDIATWMAVFAAAGVRAYYGPNLLTPIAQPGALDDYTRQAMEKTLFSAQVIGEVPPSPRTTPIEWKDLPADQIVWTPNPGYRILQGRGKVRGRLFGGCAGPLQQIMGTPYFPDRDFFDGVFFALECMDLYGSSLATLHQLRAFAAAGSFDRAAGLLVGPTSREDREVLLKVIRQEVHREDLVILENVDFVHRTPMTVLPIGALCEIDCDSARLSILEPGVRWGPTILPIKEPAHGTH